MFNTIVSLGPSFAPALTRRGSGPNESFIASADAKGDVNFLIAFADATAIGVCGIAMGEGPAPELGYWLGLSYWGQGFATEAARAVIDYAFADLKLESIQAGARVTNPASRRVLEKCGFQWTGVGLVAGATRRGSGPHCQGSNQLDQPVKPRKAASL